MPNDRELEALKVPPHSIEAEQSVLGGLLLDNGAADRVADILGADDFYSDAHRLLYKTTVGLIADNKPADVVTLAEALQSLTKLDYVGGMAYLGALVENVPTAANIRRYAEIVRERAILRRLAAAGGEIADVGLPSAGPQRARDPRPRRDQGIRNRRAWRARPAGFPGDPSAADAGRRAHRVPVQPRQSRPTSPASRPGSPISTA